MEGTRDMFGQFGLSHSAPSPGGSRPGAPNSTSTPRDRWFSSGTPFKRLAIPLPKRGPCFVGALEKRQQRLLRRGSVAHVLIPQEEFSQFATVEGLRWTNGGGWQSRRLRRGIGIERRGGETVIAGPEATTDLFMGHRFARHAIGPRSLGGAPTGEERHGEVEAAPEEVDGTALAHKRRAEALHDALGLGQDAPEALGVERVVGGVDFIDIATNGTLHLAGQGVDGDLDTQRVQAVHEFAVKRGHRTRDEWQRLRGSLAGTQEEGVFEEVKRIKDGVYSSRGRIDRPPRRL
jgi:hypothetical protein